MKADEIRMGTRVWCVMDSGPVLAGVVMTEPDLGACHVLVFSGGDRVFSCDRLRIRTGTELGVDREYWRAFSELAPHVEDECSVERPPHYTFSSVEPLDAIEAWGLNFALGNVIKYVARCAHKGSKLKDLRKARVYLDREIKRTEKERGE